MTKADTQHSREDEMSWVTEVRHFALEPVLNAKSTFGKSDSGKETASQNLNELHERHAEIAVTKLQDYLDEFGGLLAGHSLNVKPVAVDGMIWVLLDFVFLVEHEELSDEQKQTAIRDQETEVREAEDSL